MGEMQNKSELKEIEENLRINSKDLYNTSVSIAGLYKKLYGVFPKIGLSGAQAECADELLAHLPEPTRLAPEINKSELKTKVNSMGIPLTTAQWLAIEDYYRRSPKLDRGKIAEIIEGTKAWKCLYLEVNDEILADVVWYLSTAIATALEKERIE